LQTGKAEVTRLKDGEKLMGNWELVDARDHRYRIDMLAFSSDFTVVPSATGCVLASGSLRRADLSQSWFTRRKRDSGDLIASTK
jgi:alpha-tubulin suppressor-like RCC1 family protein